MSEESIVPEPIKISLPDSLTDPFKKGKRKEWFLSTAISIFALVIICGAGYWYFGIYSRSGLLIVESDPNIQIKINNHVVTNNSSDKGIFIEKRAGQYNLTIEKSSYLPFTQTIQLSRGKTIEIRPTYTVMPALYDPSSFSNSSIDFVRPSLDQKTIYYLGDNRSALYRMETANQVQIKLTKDSLSNVRDVQWSTATNVALINQTNGIFLQELPYYDLLDQNIVKIADNTLISPVWDPTNSERLAAAYFTPEGEKSLIFTDKKISKLERKADLKDLTNPLLKWSTDSKYILIINRSLLSSENNIYLYKTEDGSLRQFTQEGYVTDASFSPDSTKLLIERVKNNDNIPGLYSQMINSENLEDLNMSNTVAKSTWKDDDSLYIPESKSNALILFNVKDKSKKEIPFSFASQLDIKGMYYFESKKDLVFYTSNAIYSIFLTIE